MNIDYALVTSTSLPTQVKQSVNYVSLDKAQWLDLVDYSEDLASEDPDQRLLFLICARGTADQEETDRLRAEEAAEKKAQSQSADAEALAAQQARDADAASREATRDALRKKSRSIFNSLYGR
tara:strand:- start:1037 stop:1405 length:369 start_codon:yes stop_codon:yes gene_type:complete